MGNQTPGPWTVARSGEGSTAIYRAGRENPICKFGQEDGEGYVRDYPGAKENAPLVAASPDLLKALEGLQRYADHPDVRGLWADLGQSREFKKALRDARAAISKAKGGNQ